MKARHGHATQTGVTVHELGPYLRKVEERYAANPTSPAWSLLRQRWSRTVEAAQATVANYAEGRTVVQWHLQACQHVMNLAGSVDPMRVIKTYCAMYWMLEEQPRRFRSDKAFDHQVARRVRNLAKVAAGTYWNHRLQRTSRVYRDVPPRATEELARMLKEAFGTAGLQLARWVPVDREAEERRQLDEAIAAMQ
jgi:hypothetical protein